MGSHMNCCSVHLQLLSAYTSDCHMDLLGLHVIQMSCVASADFSLTLKRMVLRKLTLAPPSGAGGLPRLLPLGLFAAVPRSLSLYDVRMVVGEKEFQEYLGFFRQQLRTSRDVTSAGPTMHTVGSGLCMCKLQQRAWLVVQHMTVAEELNTCSFTAVRQCAAEQRMLCCLQLKC